MGTEGRRCPRCGSFTLRPVEATDRKNLLCTTCRRCWYPEHRYLIEVNRHDTPALGARTECCAG